VEFAGGRIEVLVERRVMGFAGRWSVGSFIDEWCGFRVSG
jgi:hypothetical protein